MQEFDSPYKQSPALTKHLSTPVKSNQVLNIFKDKAF